MDNPSPPSPWWHAPALILGFIGLYLLWAIGFDWACCAMSGGVIESVLGWLSRVWLWGVLIVFGLGVVVSAMSKR